MFRIAILTAALVAGAGATASAQPFPRFPTRPPLPAPPELSDITGVWYMSGDPFKPTSIQAVRGPWGPYLLLTNEKGQQSRGRLLLGGRRIIADDWEPGRGGLIGDIRGDRIIWHNDTDWIR
jgi:hypothetical protein